MRLLIRSLARRGSGRTDVRRHFGGRTNGWRCFSAVADGYKSEPGLFGLEGLHEAKDWGRIASSCIERCEQIVSHFRNLNDVQPVILQNFDDLSDTLCRVLDCAELCRNVHPDPVFSSAADQAFNTVSEYMQELNADTDLYNSLVRLEARGIVLSEEERTMCLSLRRDFERGGIHLAPSDRKNVVALQSEMHNLGAQFNFNIQACGTDTLSLPAERLRPMPQLFIQGLQRARGRTHVVELPLSPQVVGTVLKWVPDPEVRRQVYEASVCRPNEKVLQRLLSVRQQIATLLGFDSYLNLSLVDRVSTSPASVRSFLDSLALQVSDKASRELADLKALKTKKEGEVAGRHIYPWDRLHYISMAKTLKAGADGSHLSELFPLSACLNGLSLIMKELFGIDLVTCKASGKELWHPDVTKVEIRHEADGVLGHIYLDLLPRSGKYNQAAHFTIRCGRSPGPNMEYQTPLVALVCNFAREESSQQTMLTYSDLEALFHEFGHAVHSLLARTRFQNLAGARGPVDFVEIPSHLFEHFVRDHRVLSRFAKSMHTGKSITRSQLETVLEGRRQFAAMDIQEQIMLSALDLELHSGSHQRDYAEAYSTLEQKFTNLSSKRAVPSHTTFGHLVGYGAGYYSYLYAKVLAAEIWRAMFLTNPLSRQSGNLLRSRLLVYGASREPRALITSLIGQDMSILSFMREIGIVEITLTCLLTNSGFFLVSRARKAREKLAKSLVFFDDKRQPGRTWFN